jgi:hypothetical protein
MIWLAQLLIRERWRRVLAHNGRTGCLVLGLVLTGAAAAVAAAARSQLQNASPVRIAMVLNLGWCLWTACGMLLGKDLTWHIRLERLTVFPVRSFTRLYLLGFVLSFASFPLLLLFSVLQIAVLEQVPHVTDLWIGLACYVLFVASVRLTVSVVRAAFRRICMHSRPPDYWPILSVLLPAGWIAVSSLSGLERWLPGYPLGLVLTGKAPCSPVLLTAGVVLLLTVADFTLQRSAAYSGMGGLAGSRWSTRWSGALLLIHPAWPAPLWRISLLGWIRNPNALLLWIWGGGYGFFFMLYTRADALLDYLLFGSMMLIFHAHLRGNLLGIDHKGVWLYYLLPVPADKPLRAKNQTLSLLQACMVAAGILPGIIHPAPTMDAVAWLSVLSHSIASILLGEICGSYFSLRYPEPIERSSHFSGGVTVGALLLPLLQLLFLAIFLVAIGLSRSLLPLEAMWPELALIPVILLWFRTALLPAWVRETMWNERRAILAKLTVFSS